MKITCYYEPGGDGSVRIPEEALVNLWVKKWTLAGWDPVVLDERHARAHPLFDAMVSKAAALPHLLDEFCQRAVMVRWLAWAQVGGVVTDYDVFPFKEFEYQPVGHSLSGSLVHRVGFIAASKEWMEGFCKVMLEYTPKDTDLFDGKPTVADETILMNRPDLFAETRDMVRLFGEDGWRDVPLVHLNNNSVRHRFQLAKALLNL